MSEPMASPTCAVVVLNWNGRTHLEHLLPSLYEARRVWGHPLPIVVVDNRSTEGDAEWLAAAHPSVEVVVAPANDYLFSLNPVVSGRAEDVIIVLNNDMRVHPAFIAPLVAAFADPRVFAVSARVLDWDGQRQQNGPRRARIHRFWCYQDADRFATEPAGTVETGGGSSAYRRTQFAELGGFDDLYRPGYWEDFDLTYRGWMRGWISIFEPRSIIYHRGSATMSEIMPPGQIGRLMARNQLLFVLKNVGGWGFTAGVLAMMPYRLLISMARRNWTLLGGTLAAVPRFGAAFRRRWAAPAAVMSAPAIAAAAASAPVPMVTAPPHAVTQRATA